ncbi:hypothetical protein NC661_21070 [Aquibacillus koreensis]|uniref:Uncharacterized protein n=1 Tax=Aquibacillus koreensis TaxID=279446 RepID=A0A9X3WQG4_9BACI|nr:hypothetical protein [Aquibacillus koreensis]MCT2535321.1 hypothetical protein [Aquibacillus koreensis]MDC3422838.1 hypothetical protein [Aquibacillus koreensis]
MERGRVWQDSIYLFFHQSNKEKKEGFEEQTETMDLELHETYTNKNALVFYGDTKELLLS